MYARLYVMAQSDWWHHFWCKYSKRQNKNTTLYTLLTTIHPYSNQAAVYNFQIIEYWEQNYRILWLGELHTIISIYYTASASLQSCNWFSDKNYLRNLLIFLHISVWLMSLQLFLLQWYSKVKTWKQTWLIDFYFLPFAYVGVSTRCQRNYHHHIQCFKSFFKIFRLFEQIIHSQKQFTHKGSDRSCHIVQSFTKHVWEYIYDTF